MGIAPPPGAMMKVADQNRSQRTPAAPLAVGTRGRVERMRGPCACPRQDATLVPHIPLMNPMASRTSTRPPPIPASTPCPYLTIIHKCGRNDSCPGMMREMCLLVGSHSRQISRKRGTLPLPLSQGKPENPKMCIIVRLKPGDLLKILNRKLFAATEGCAGKNLTDQVIFLDPAGVWDEQIICYLFQRF